VAHVCWVCGVKSCPGGTLQQLVGSMGDLPAFVAGDWRLTSRRHAAEDRTPLSTISCNQLLASRNRGAVSEWACQLARSVRMFASCTL
jgi:hypothetical protein